MGSKTKLLGDNQSRLFIASYGVISPEIRKRSRQAIFINQRLRINASSTQKILGRIKLAVSARLWPPLRARECAGFNPRDALGSSVETQFALTALPTYEQGSSTGSGRLAKTRAMVFRSEPVANARQFESKGCVRLRSL